MKDKKIAVLLSFLVGGLGAHKFYLDENKKGLFYLLFCWTLIPGILSVIDFFKLIFMKQEDFDKKYNSENLIS